MSFKSLLFYLFFPTFELIFVILTSYVILMKQINRFNSFFVCIFLLCFFACDNEHETIDKEIPLAILQDVSKRLSPAEIKNYRFYSEGISQIDCIDTLRNETSAWYVDETWTMTHTLIEDVRQLSPEALKTFEHSGYGDARLLDIYKTEREGMERSLYTLHFQYRWKNVENMEHYLFINDDGRQLATFTWIPNNPCGFPRLPKDHFDFISQKYKGAEVRGYVNNGGRHEYFISHRDTLKYVLFGGLVATDAGFWEETTYELSLDTPIPEDVARRLKQDDPDFTYTNLYYKESDAGNAYLFQDKNREDELGYWIFENIGPDA